MYIGSSIFLIAVGAILRWAVSWHLSGFNIQLAGLIVFLVGILGLAITLILWYTRRSSHGGRREDGVPPQDYRPE
jgi:fluoride ion exporter CrcB/FEX